MIIPHHTYDSIKPPARHEVAKFVTLIDETGGLVKSCALSFPLRILMTCVIWSYTVNSGRYAAKFEDPFCFGTFSSSKTLEGVATRIYGMWNTFWEQERAINIYVPYRSDFVLYYYWLVMF